MNVRASFEVSDKTIVPADFGLVLVLNKKEFKAGDELSLEISSEKACYPYIFSVDANSRVFRLFPNPVQETFLLKKKIKLPTDKMIYEGYRIVIFPSKDCPIPQREEIVFICTKKKVKAFEEFFPSAFAEDPEDLKELLTGNYRQTLERFNEILTQIGAENYDITGDFYIIKP